MNMKRILKNTIIISIILMMLLGVLAPIFASNRDDFESNPGKYDQLCSSYSESSAQVCREYRAYLLERAQNNQAAKNEISNKLKDIETNLMENLGLIQEFENQITALDANIKTLELEIAQKEQHIQELQVEIQTRETEIAKLEEEIKTYMVQSQMNMRVNGYIEFLMGATDFSDIMRRVVGMNSIRRYNESLIDNFKSQKQALEETKAAVATEIENIELNKSLVVVDKENIVYLQAGVQKIYDELVIQKVNFEMQEAQVQAAIELDQATADAINAIPPTNGLSSPVPTGRKTESVWGYSWGGTHLGVDLSAGYFEPIYAVGNGVVVVTQGGCDTYSSFGCNSGLGNHLSMIFESNGKVYGALIMHMANGSFKVGPGSVVNQGQQVGGVGNSGNSIGSHAHIEIFDLGVGSVSEGVSMWNSTWRTAQFGLGGSDRGQSSRCEYKGSTPCRIDPEAFLGV